MYHGSQTFGKSEAQPDGGEGRSGMVWQRGIGNDASGGSRLAEARYRKGTG